MQEPVQPASASTAKSEPMAAPTVIDALRRIKAAAHAVAAAATTPAMPQAPQEPKARSCSPRRGRSSTGLYPDGRGGRTPVFGNTAAFEAQARPLWRATASPEPSVQFFPSELQTGLGDVSDDAYASLVFAPFVPHPPLRPRSAVQPAANLAAATPAPPSRRSASADGSTASTAQRPAAFETMRVQTAAQVRSGDALAASASQRPYAQRAAAVLAGSRDPAHWSACGSTSAAHGFMYMPRQGVDPLASQVQSSARAPRVSVANPQKGFPAQYALTAA